MQVKRTECERAPPPWGPHRLFRIYVDLESLLLQHFQRELHGCSEAPTCPRTERKKNKREVPFATTFAAACSWAQSCVHHPGKEGGGEEKERMHSHVLRVKTRGKE